LTRAAVNNSQDAQLQLALGDDIMVMANKMKLMLLIEVLFN
jgi:hypothetical protein